MTEMERLIELNALISEREGMIAENKFRETGGNSPAYDERFFVENAALMRALLPSATQGGKDGE